MTFKSSKWSLSFNFTYIQNLQHVAILQKIIDISNVFCRHRYIVASFGDVNGRRWQSNDKGKSNPLPDVHAHNPSIPQHQQKIRKQSWGDYLMPRWWLPEVPMLCWDKEYFFVLRVSKLTGPLYFCLLKGFDHDQCHPDSSKCTSSRKFYDKSVSKYHRHIIENINDLHSIW